MPKTRLETALHAATLCVCFGLPLALETRPDYLPLMVVLAGALLHWIATRRSDDPFLSTARVGALAWLLYANAVAYGLSDRPDLLQLGPSAGLVLLVSLAVMLFVIVRSSARVASIDLEYFQYSLPSKRLTVDMGRRTGRLDQAQAALRLQLFVKEGLQFRRLSRVCRLLVMQTWAGMGVFVLFGFHEPWHFLIFLLNSVLVTASATSIASRATLHPGQPLVTNDWIDVDDDDDGVEEDYEEYRPRRRHPLAR